MVEYLQELRVRDGNNIRIINSHIFKEKYMTDDEIERHLFFRRYKVRNLGEYNYRGELKWQHKSKK